MVIDMISNDFKTLGNTGTSNKVVMSVKNCNVFFTTTTYRFS